MQDSRSCCILSKAASLLAELIKEIHTSSYSTDTRVCSTVVCCGVACYVSPVCDGCWQLVSLEGLQQPLQPALKLAGITRVARSRHNSDINVHLTQTNNINAHDTNSRAHVKQCVKALQEVSCRHQTMQLQSRMVLTFIGVTPGCVLCIADIQSSHASIHWTL